MMKLKNLLVCGGWCVALVWSMTSFARDPFFPLGYEVKKDPPPPVVERPAITQVPVIAPPTPTQKPKEITSEDWGAARKLIQMSGFAVAGDRQVVLINGKSYRIGDKISVTNRFVVFTWRIEIPAERKLNLVPVEAVRL
jgi:hypothetical protein